MKRLLIALLFAVPVLAGPENTVHVRIGLIENFPDPQTNTFCAANLSCTVTGAWTFSTGPVLGSLTVSGAATFTGPTSFTASGVFTNTQANLGFQSLLNSCGPANQFQSLFTAQRETEAITGCITVPASSTVFQTNTISGFVENQSGATTAGVALFGGARVTTTNGGRVWGINTVATDVPGITSNGVYGAEFDVNANNAGTITHGNLCGALWNVQPTDSRCFEVGKPQGGFWPYGLYFNVGATQTPSNSGAGILFGPVASGISQVSQGMTFIGQDSGGINNFAFVNAGVNGDLVIANSKAGAGLQAVNVKPTAAASGNIGTTLLPWANLCLGTAATNNWCTSVAATATARTLVWNDTNGVASVALPFFGSAGTAGYQTKRVASCTTGAAAASTCTTTVTWTTAFPDANYTAVCMIDGPTGVPYVLGSQSKAGASIVVSIANLTAVAASGTLNCKAQHD